MKRIIIWVLLLLVAFPHFLLAQKEFLYVGTFGESGSNGIYVFNFNRENAGLKHIQSIPGKASPSFLAIHPSGKYLYAVYREGMTPDTDNGTIAAFSINQQTGKLTMLNEQSSEGAGPCHVSIDPEGKFAYVSNYRGGNLSIYPIQNDGKLEPASDVIQHEGSGANPDRQQEPHMHSIIPAKNGKFIYASDLGIDKILVYNVNRNSGNLTPADNPFVETKPGAGPRHFDLHPNGKFGYSAEELNSSIAAYKVNESNGGLQFIQRLSMLPEDFTDTNYPADIQVSPDGNHVYASNRGHNSLAHYNINKQTGKMDLVGHEPTRGKWPRNFLIDRDGEFAFVANQNSGTVVVFNRDQNSGKLSYGGTTIAVPGAVCIQQLKLP